MLNDFVNQLILAQRSGISAIALQNMLMSQGASEEEISDLLEILALEKRKEKLHEPQ